MASGTLTAIDYSFKPPGDYAACVRSGVQLFARYLSPSSGKDFTPDEVRTVHKLGAGALPLWEQWPDDALKGYSEGQAHGAGALAALASLRQSVGYAQRNKPGIGFSIDFDVQPSQYPAIVGYVKGVRSKLGTEVRLGVYGHANLLNYLFGQKLIDFGYQTYAWSNGVVSPHADLYQFLNAQNFHGGTVDFCELHNPAALGAWWPPGHPLDIPEDDMPLSADDLKNMKAALLPAVDDLVTTRLRQLTSAVMTGNDQGPFTHDAMQLVIGSFWSIQNQFNLLRGAALTQAQVQAAAVAAYEQVVTDNAGNAIDIAALASAITTNLSAITYTVKAN